MLNLGWTARAMHVAPPLPDTSGAPIRPRHALLLNPYYAKDRYSSFAKHVVTPTLALTSVAGATPSDWSVEYWDENLLQGPPPADPIPAVVGITVHLTFARRAYALAAWYRARGAKVVLGGLHVQSCPDECAPHADAICLGNGVECWPDILRDAAHGTLQPIYRGSYRVSYADEPAPRRDLLPRRAFLTTTSLMATRGCHNRCDFCYLSTDGVDQPYRMRTPEQVAAEFEADGQPYGLFVDNSLATNHDYLRRLCRALRPLEKIWTAALTIDVTDDVSLVREMALSGCTGVFVGLESLTNDNLLDATKRSPHTGDYARRIKILQDHGIQVNGSFVVGFDRDDAGVFDRLGDWIEEVKLDWASCHILTPYPGTPLFRRLEAQGRLLHKDWERYDAGHVVFQPAQMSPDELADGFGRLHRRVHSLRSMWRRRPAGWGALPPHLAKWALYKRSNWLWNALIRRQWTARAWWPLVEMSRRKHLRFRRELEARPEASPTGMCVAPGV